MTSLTVLSPCKLNLFLYITGRRPDGYHNLQTLFSLLNYGDEMTFTPRDDGRIVIDGPFDFPVEKNLIYKAALLLKERLPQDRAATSGCSVRVLKRIPEGGGLGGGSSNAATTLLILNKLWKVGLQEEELESLGLTLGADVPVFVRGTAAFASGVGEKLTSLTLPPSHAVVVTPEVAVNTKEAFADPDLKRDTPVRELNDLMLAPFGNDFTDTVVKKHPEIGLTLTSLLKYGPARLSGSGSSCYVLMDSSEAAVEAVKELNATGRYKAVFAADVLSLSPLHDVLQAL